MKIELKLDNWNDTINHCRYNKYSANLIKQKEMQQIAYFLKDMKPITEYPIQIVFTWHIKNIRSDLDNKSVKSILDCMQKLGIIENDNIKYINKITHIAIKDSCDYVEVDISKQ